MLESNKCLLGILIELQTTDVVLTAADVEDSPYAPETDSVQWSVCEPSQSFALAVVPCLLSLKVGAARVSFVDWLKLYH